MADMPRWHRLSHRGRRPLLQRSPSLRPRRSRRAADRADGRNLPQGRADRRAHAHERQSQTHDGGGTHAVQPSAIRRLDDRAHPRRRTPDRTGDRRAISSRSGGPIPNRDSEPGSASCASSDRSASIVSKPPPPAPSRSARSPTDRSVPSSTTSSIVTLRTSAPQTACRSSIPTFAARATINRRPRLAHPSNPRPIA
jgi:hypothetical protein